MKEMLEEVLFHVIEEVEKIRVNDVKIEKIEKITEFETPLDEKCNEHHWVLLVSAIVDGEYRYRFIFVISLTPTEDDGVNCTNWHYYINVLDYGPLWYVLQFDDVEKLAEWLLREAGVA